MGDLNKSDKFFSVAVLGAGSWGTALAVLLANKGISVKLWSRRREHADLLNRTRENSLYLPDVVLPDKILVCHSLEQVVRQSNVILFVVPSHVTRQVAEQVSEILSSEIDKGSPLPMAVLSASKGIEQDSLLTMTEVLKDVLPDIIASKLAVLSGPSFAEEVARDVPTAVTVAATEDSVANMLQHLFATNFFRVYTSSDVVGVQLGGAIKNVMAIAAGISDGLGFGTNTRAALITRGLAELTRLAVRKGANPLTLAGLAGLGDLILTCTGDLSRNRTVGLELGRGKALSDILKEMNMVAEGVKTTKAVWQLAERYSVEMPITQHVYHVLYKHMDPKDSVRRLLLRPPRPEVDFL